MKIAELISDHALKFVLIFQANDFEILAPNWEAAAGEKWCQPQSTRQKKNHSNGQTNAYQNRLSANLFTFFSPRFGTNESISISLLWRFQSGFNFKIELCSVLKFITAFFFCLFASFEFVLFLFQWIRWIFLSLLRFSSLSWFQFDRWTVMASIWRSMFVRMTKCFVCDMITRWNCRQQRTFQIELKREKAAVRGDDTCVCSALCYARVAPTTANNETNRKINKQRQSAY